MGKATVLQVLGDGQYRIEMDYGQAVKQAKIDELSQLSLKLLGEINQKESEYFIKEGPVIALQQEANVLIQAYSELMAADPLGDYTAQKQEINEVLEQIIVAGGDLSSLQAEIDSLKFERAQVERNKGEIAAIGVLQERNAWCVDYTLTAAGEVATIEIPGENDAVVIQPGARAPTSADGDVRARGLLDPNQAFYNAAILPGWQKWMPTYRKATVLSVNKAANTANVALDDARSSAQNLPVNFEAALNNVPVQYMTCNARVFEPGDRVVVELVGMDWSNPRIIGFVDNPKRCRFANGWKIAEGKYLKEAEIGPYDGWVWYDETPNGGNQSWKSSIDDSVVSWYGPDGRHIGRNTVFSRFAYYENTPYIMGNVGTSVKGACKRTIDGVEYIYAVVLLNTLNDIEMRRVEVGGSTVSTVWGARLNTSAPSAVSGGQWNAFFSPDSSKCVFVVGKNVREPGYLFEINTDVGITATRDLSTWNNFIASSFTRSCSNVLCGASFYLDYAVTSYAEQVLFAEYNEENELLLAKICFTGVTEFNVSNCSDRFYQAQTTVEVKVGDTVIASTNESVLHRLNAVTITKNREYLVSVNLLNLDSCIKVEHSYEWPTQFPSVSQDQPHSARMLVGETEMAQGSTNIFGNLGSYINFQDTIGDCEFLTLPNGNWNASNSLPLVFYDGYALPTSANNNINPNIAFALNQDGKYILYHGAVTFFPQSVDLWLNYIPFTFANTAPFVFYSNDIEQSDFEDQSGKTLPYGVLGII
jgi:hypothetical protein